MTATRKVGGTGSGRSPATLPTLKQAERAALKASIEHWGIVYPVVFDQTDEVLDGFNRMDIAEELDMEVPFTVIECTPEEREILRIELNTSRRQIPDDTWKVLVDHLRELGYADRVIAKAVGVDRMKVRRHKRADTAGGSSDPPAARHAARTARSTRGEGNHPKRRHVAGCWS